MSNGFKCFLCGKGIMVGHNVSHAKNRTRKVFKPNLHPARISVNGTIMKVRLCTKCLREVKGKNKRSLKAAEKAKVIENEKISTIAPVASGLA